MLSTSSRSCSVVYELPAFVASFIDQSTLDSGMELPNPLDAAWRHLLFLNYEVSPDLLLPYLPLETELDLYDGEAFLSLVGLMFLDTKLFGIPDPFHQAYEQVNLRFYVRERASGRRGVVFIKEIVPATLVTTAARLLLNEHYITHPMTHQIDEHGGELYDGGLVEYGWESDGRRNCMRARVAGESKLSVEGSREEFVMDRLYGYGRIIGGAVAEYQLEHPKWSYFDVADAELDCDIATIYGPEFLPYLSTPPGFSFVATGSDVSLRGVRRL